MNMRMLTVIAVLVAALVSPVRSAPNRASGAPRWFAETGHTLAYSFGLFWDSHGDLPVFGYPITEVFIESGQAVQYFERARLEWHGELGLVQVGHLGRWALQQHTDNPALAPVARPQASDRDYFAETGHTLGGDFRQFWRSRGGLPLFGLPLSEEFPEVNAQDGAVYLVQYFERARFEWHPELPAGARVQLGHLGRRYLEATNAAPPSALAPVSGAAQAWDGVRPTRIRMPRIALGAAIVEGGFTLRGWDVPRYDAAHYWPVAGFPATPGNIVIAGHSGYKDTIFNHLPDTTRGDEIIVSIGPVERRYRVMEIWTVGPDDAWVMAPLPRETLTLITCVPIGVYSHRLIVRGIPIEETISNRAGRSNSLVRVST
jgi:LPXTG-site transpeptidase (sortase) family protein